MSDGGSPQNAPKPDEQPEHLNIKVTDSNNEVFFKIKRTTQLKKLMDAFCERQGKSPASVRFLFDGQRVNPTDNPESVSFCGVSICLRWRGEIFCSRLTRVCLLARHAGRRYPRGASGAGRRLLSARDASEVRRQHNIAGNGQHIETPKQTHEARGAARTIWLLPEAGGGGYHMNGYFVLTVGRKIDMYIQGDYRRTTEYGARLAFPRGRGEEWLRISLPPI